MNRTAPRTLLLGLTVLTVGLFASPARAGSAEIGFLVAPGSMEQLTPESEAACDVARRLVGARLIRPTGSATVVGRDGRPVALDQFAAIWLHQGDTAAVTEPTAEGRMLSALRQYVLDGHGLLLSGTAARFIAPLKAGAVQIKPVTFGHDRGQAGLVPVQLGHPAFRGLTLERDVLWMSNAVYPAFAAFRPAARPAGGILLARTPGGPENPLMEFPLGKGRVIALAWRLSPHYHVAPDALRANFERLACNLLAYLAHADAWQAPEPPAKRLGVPANEWQALAMAIDDLDSTFGDRYPNGAAYRRRLRALKQSHDAQVASGRDADALAKTVGAFGQLRREALLANPLLDIDRLLLVRRRANKMGLPKNYQSNSSLAPVGYDNEIAILSPVRPEGRLTTVFRPEGGQFVGDVDLHFDAERLLFSMPAEGGRWRVFDMHADGSHRRCLPLINEPDVDNYDACYLPDDRIIFTSTAPFTGVPCVRGSSHVANLYLLETDGRIRRLTVEQDHDWCPTVLPDGRVLYLRWEYSDIPHAFSRILFRMNPDGSGQMAYYGSNSYWPASMFYARPIPGHPTKVAAIVGGHHDLPRMGDLVIFDRGGGQFEADGAVQRILSRGRPVAPVLLDLPIGQTWPKFLHPYPLSEKYFLVSCKPSEGAPWGVYVADVFDNLVRLYDEPDYAMLEPIPLRKTPRPPVLPDRVDVTRPDAEVFLANIYAGPGLKGVARGTIRSLRLISYHFAYQGMGGEPDAMGLDGPWDVRRILGTVPVHADGSAYFRVPAYTPVAVQPLDADGKAVQLMRSWFTAMPGEVLSCVGCHEAQNAAPPTRDMLAAHSPPAAIRPWYGPARGVDFRREVQPVLDRYCVGCHNGKPRPDGRPISDLTDRDPVPTMANKHAYNLAARFTPSYYALRKRVRTPTREGDMHLLPPWEFHADTTRLVQMLQKGHHNVRLDAEAWDRLVTWIDLNAPAHGTWTAICGPDRVKHQWQRRCEMQKRYTGIVDDPETIAGAQPPPVEPVMPEPPPTKPVASAPDCPGWPFDAAEARRRQAAGGGPATLTLSLADGVSMELVRIPAGEFILGRADGYRDESPPCRVRVAAAFWMGRFEVTNEQFAAFDPSHDSGLEYGDYIQFSPGERGWMLSRPRQPVVRVSWSKALAFCRWLSATTGRTVALPTEAQWEYACRAGTATPLWYGTVDSDFSGVANLSDATHQAIDRFGWSGRASVIPPWRPADTRYNDHSRVSAPVGTYAPNPWGLHDMHGNVAEWTLSVYRPYPAGQDDGRNQTTGHGKRVVRGGSWYDRPDRCRSAFRQAYRPEQGVYDVGFRVVCDVAADTTATVSQRDARH